MTIVPEDFRVPSFGRSSLADSSPGESFDATSSFNEDAEDDVTDDEGLARGSVMAGTAAEDPEIEDMLI